MTTASILLPLAVCILVTWSAVSDALPTTARVQGRHGVALDEEQLSPSAPNSVENKWTEERVAQAAERARFRDRDGRLSAAIEAQLDYDRIATAPLDRPTSLLRGVQDPEPGVVYDHLYIGAHLDDAVWSVGGEAIRNVEQGKKALLVTIFTGVGYKAKWWDFVLSPSTLNYTQRVIEDENAANVINQAAKNGGRFDHLHLHFPDLPYRTLHENILGGLALAGIYIPYVNSKLRSAIQTKLEGALTTLANTSSTLYFPLGVGRHPDHIQAFLAGYTAATVRPQYHTIFYQDIPYMLNPKEIKWRLQGHSKEMYWFRRSYAPSFDSIADVWDVKIHAMEQYVTQLPMYWTPAKFEQEFLQQTNKTEFLWKHN